MDGSPSHDPSLLLMACSQRKTPGMARGRAWDVYDGQLFRILKNLFRERADWKPSLRILIISARHGVLEPDQVIATYDERLTPVLARARGDLWKCPLRRQVTARCYRAVHVNLGKIYLSVLPDLESLAPGTPIDRAKGGIGVRNSQTRRWVLEQLAHSGKSS